MSLSLSLTLTLVRRILFIFVALLLAGAGALAVYIAHATPAQDALSFSLVDISGPREIYAGLSGPCSVETIAIQNTSTVPVQLISMWVAEGESSGRGQITFAVAPTSTSTATAAIDPVRERLATSTRDVVIPPHGTIYAISSIPLAGLTAEPSETLSMNFLWQSRLHYLAGRAFEWLHARSPRALQAHIPGVRASLHQASLTR
jgi:hypothetical protein